MYIWIACDLSDGLAEIREKCTEFNRDLQLSEVAFSLPQHISLKISFDVDDAISDSVIETVKSYLSAQKSFSVFAPVPEMMTGILWLRFSESESLTRLHGDLDELLSSHFGVPRHEYDRSFKFHSTLFMDDGGDLSEMYRRVSSLTMPSELVVDSFLIGISESGRAGDYRVYRRIMAKK
jgi:2'-5' RNA ligase